MGTEVLRFKIELYATMWDQAPHVDIIIDGQSKIKERVHQSISAPHIFEFTHELEEGKEHQLILKRSNKLKGQTLIDNDGKILKDQLLHIKRIEIDEIDLGSMIFEGVFTPDYSTASNMWYNQMKNKGNEPPKEFKNCTALGHDGEWKFTFESPFYMWLLENLY